MLPPVACCANVLLAMRPTPPKCHVAQRSDSDAPDKSRMAATPPGSLAVSGEYDLARRTETRKEQFDARTRARLAGSNAAAQKAPATLQFDNHVVR
jgi:hypothetical protein